MNEPMPATGGSYTRDPETGELKPATAPAEPVKATKEKTK